MMERDRTFMATEVWSKIVRDYVVPYRDVNRHLNPPTILPHKDGEPLLHKRLPEMLLEASQAAPDMHIDVYTHGLLLPRRSGFIEFLGSLPNKVRLLVSFHFHNHDGSTNDYNELTGFFQRFFRGPRPGNVEIIFASHLIAPMTRERLEEWAASWRPYGIAVHANVNINPWTGLMKDVATCAFPSACPYHHFDHWFFGATGNVIACCLDLEEEIVLGNVMVDDPQAMFEKTREFYQEQERIAQDRSRIKNRVCRDCFGLPPEPKLQQIGVTA